ncbi:MAG: porin [Myxococcota bacterium]
MIWLTTALAGPATVEHTPGDGFTLTSDDGRFALTFRSRLQLLETVARTGDAPFEQGLTLRRARFDVSGHGFGEAHRWRMQLGFSDSDIGNTEDGPRGNPLLDAYWHFSPRGPLHVRLGQYKVPLTRSRIASTATLQLVDRPELDGEFGLDRDRGVTAVLSAGGASGPQVRSYFGVFEGNGRIASPFQDLGLLLVGRLEVQPLGPFDYYADGDLERSEDLRLGFGGGVASVSRAPLSKGITGPPFEDGRPTDMTLWTADLVVRWHGVSLEVTGGGRTGIRRAPAGAEPPRNGAGITGQLGVMVPKIPVGVAVRHTHIDPTGASSLLRVRETLGAVSWFLHGHPYDLTADFGRIEIGGEETLRGRLQLELAL